MSYAEVDAAIQRWSAANALVLFMNFAGREARFCYLSSERGECLQISISPPEFGRVRVGVWDVETIDDEVVQELWEVSSAEVGAALDTALAHAREWLGRHRNE